MVRVGVPLFAVAALAAAKPVDRQAPVIHHTPCAAYRPGAPVEIVVQLEDDSELFDPKVLYRSPPTSDWRTLSLVADADGARHRAVIPADQLAGPLHYVIEAFDIHGNGPAQHGTLARPLVLPPDPQAPPCDVQPPPPLPLLPPSSVLSSPTVTGPVGPSDQPAAQAGRCAAPDAPFYCEPWVWGVWGGVAVAAAAVVTVVLVAGGGDPPPERVVLEINGPSPTDHR